jgi:hypothetical protein
VEPDKRVVFSVICKVSACLKSTEVELKSGRSVKALLGGVGQCHPGSAGILLAYRYVAWYLLQELQLLQHYRWIIFTRSDYLFACPPKEDLSTLPRDKIYVPRSSGRAVQVGSIRPRVESASGFSA